MEYGNGRKPMQNEHIKEDQYPESSPNVTHTKVGRHLAIEEEDKIPNEDQLTEKNQARFSGVPTTPISYTKSEVDLRHRALAVTPRDESSNNLLDPISEQPGGEKSQSLTRIVHSDHNAVIENDDSDINVNNRPDLNTGMRTQNIPLNQTPGKVKNIDDRTIDGGSMYYSVYQDKEQLRKKGPLHEMLASTNNFG